MSRARDLSKLGNPNVIVADTERVGFGTQVPENAANASSSLISAGIVTAAQFFGDGSNLEGVASAGLGTAVDDTKDSIGQNIYFTNAELSINTNTTVNAPDTSNIAYTQYQQVTVESGSELIIADGDSFIPDVLGIGTALQPSNITANGNGLFGTVYVDNIENAAGRGGPNFPLGITVVGVSTLGGNVSIGGTLTYEDVTNVDSVGVVTARSGIDVSAGGIDVTAGGVKVTSGNILLTGGNNTKVSFAGDGSAHYIKMDTTLNGPVINGYGGIAFETFGANERLRIGSAGQIGLGGANYGTSGQVMTSQGASAAPQWADAGGGAWEFVSTVFCPDLNNAQDNIDFVGLTTAYSAYKVVFTGCTFSHRDTGARNSDKVLAYLRNTSNTWVTGSTYTNKSCRFNSGTPVGYDGDEGSMKLTCDNYADMFSGELTIPMAFNNVNSNFGDKVFYGDFMTDNSARIMFGCYSYDTDIRTTGFNGIRIQSDDNKWREGRVSLYRLKHT